MTTDRNDPRLNIIRYDGQQETHIVLSEEERSKGFIRPIRLGYKHLLCNSETTIGRSIAETYAREPTFYGSTFCVNCGDYFSLRLEDNEPAFLWDCDGTPVGY